MSKKKSVSFKELNHGVKINEYCWQEVESRYMGETITRHTRVEIIDIDLINRTALVQYMLGSHMIKLSEAEFNKLKLFRNIYLPKPRHKKIVKSPKKQIMA